ncbi:Odorant receptor Or36 [Rhyzopertha dominica]|nr:Odorant receptor Or36 [Rhyzopertha dominica]
MQTPDILAFIRLVSIASGCWPLHLWKQSKLKFAYCIYKVALNAAMCSFVTGQFVQLFRIIWKGADTRRVFENTSLSIAFGIAVFKIFIAQSWKSAQLIKQISYLEETFVKNDKQQIIYRKWIILLNRMIKLLGILGTCGIVSYVMFPRIIVYQFEDQDSSLKEEPLPFSVWMPLDVHKQYNILYSLHIFCGFLALYTILSVDGCIIAFIMFAILLTEILHDTIENFRKEARRRTIESGDELDIVMTSVIRELVLKHQTLIKYVNDVDDLVTNLMTLEFATCSIQLASAVFQLIVKEMDFEQLPNIAVIAAAMAQLLFFYWPANEVRLKSMEISNAVWNSDWFKCNPKIRRDLNFIMMRAQRPLVLHIKPVYIMSIETALMIMKTVYSVLAISRQTYARNKE